jgi:hypothetical protein
VKALSLAAAIGVALSLGAMLAPATPPRGIASAPLLARGTTTGTFVVGTPRTATVTRVVTVKVKVRGKTYRRKVRVRVRVPSVTPVIRCSTAAPCDTAFQQVTINAGGSTGWHTHPGATFVAISQGEGTLYHAGASSCPSERYPARAGLYQTERDTHVLRNEAAADPLVLFAFYLLPGNTPDTGIRVDEPQPAGCPNTN